METMIAILFVLFMFLVDWRLNKIYKELRCLNSIMGKANTQKADVVTSNDLAPSGTKQMEEYNITFDGERYAYGEYKYDKLSDAINYAKRQKK